MSAHGFCNALYRSARADCVKEGIHIGRLTTHRSSFSPNTTQYEIWQDGQAKGWYSTCCAAEAKFKFLCEQQTSAREAKSKR